MVKSGIVYPTYEEFVYWHNQWKLGKCTKEYARQNVGVKSTKWYYICRDYENGLDVSKHFLHRVECVETGEVFDTPMDAFYYFRDVKKILIVPYDAIERCAKGRRKTAGKFHWRYV